MGAQEVTGLWKRQYVGYSGASVWGTGSHDIHSYYGSDPLRLGEVTQREGEITPPHQAIADKLLPTELWGYQPEDSTYTGVVYDDRPDWKTPPELAVNRRDTGDQPSWAAPQSVNERFRTVFGGAYRVFRGPMTTGPDGTMGIGYVEPTETVSEGWINKPQGQPANAKPSDPSQYERQTSMQQRYQVRNNQAATVRGTDDTRAPIDSKVTGQRLKIYSGGERHYDMLPKEQDTILRPFWFRSAGTGRRDDMIPNTLWSIRAVQRIPPADPSMGPSETEIDNSYGYTTEDTQYYA
jgi:hypothetical protein